MSDLTLHHDTGRSTEALVGRLQHRRFLHEHADLDAAHAAATAHVERTADRGRLLEVRDGDEHAGEVWVVSRGDEIAVVDLTLVRAEHAVGTRALLEELGRAESAARLTVTVSPGDPVATALVEGGGFELAATQMLLDLDHRLPAEPVVVLEPMDEVAFAGWEADELENYAQERARTGESLERAREVSREQHAELLPDGVASEHHHFFVGRVRGDDGWSTVGTLWLSTERPMAFVYDVAVHEAHRRRGHGAGLMRAGALWAQEHGAHALGLNVFGHNHAARALYDKLGYHVTEEFLGKRL
ncbi:GNAT family N-acetyltransferase [Nocardioides sp. 1609]|uniref:GNAT family N-acetyltransferase n=1 Tax=Nocardioides sp. 1609 TaxID=2508327 RepID=UPI00106F8DA1|nr:GNAT family N-acetyltransferase [Nocardioides sp. 1609]